MRLDAAGGITARTDTGNGGYGSAYGLLADENGRLSVTAGDLLLAESAYGTAFGIYAYNSSDVNAELNGGISALTGGVVGNDTGLVNVNTDDLAPSTFLAASTAEV